MENSVNSYQLSNKLPVFIAKSKKSPIVTLQVWVRTGSADEKPLEAGLSHFIEHLVFKGSKSFKAGEIAQVVEQAGGELNAYTSFDQTVFYVTVPKKNLHVASKVLSEMVTSPSFIVEEVDNEREVVVEEIKMGLDQPNRVASRFLFSTMFKGHPYSLPVIGTEENIRRVPVEEIKDYFGERYHASNISLVCVGDIDEDESKTLELLEKDFAGMKESGGAPRTRSPRHLEQERFHYKESNFERDYFYLSWPVEGFREEKTTDYEVLAMILGQGESSHLYRELKLEKSLCRSIGASYFGSEDSGLFVINGMAVGEELPKLLEELPKSLERFFEKTDLSLELLKAKNVISSEQSYSKESVASQCRLIGDDWLYYGKLGAGEERRKRVLGIKASHLNEAAKNIFSQKPHLNILSPQEFKKDEAFFKSLENLAHKDFQFTEQELPFSAPETLKGKNGSEVHYEKWKTEKGNDVIWVESRESQVVAAKLAFLGGETLNSKALEGLVSCYGSLWAREFQNLSEAEFKAHSDLFCSDFYAFSGKHSSGLSLYTLNSFYDEMSPYFLKALKETKFSPELLQREVKNKTQALQMRKDSPASVAFNSFSKALFKGTFYQRDSVGKEEDLKALSTQDLMDFHKAALQKKAVYTFVGAIEKEKVLQTVNSIEKVLETDRDESFFKNYSFDVEYKKQELFIESDKAQSHIIVAHPALNYLSSKKTHVELLMSYLGGQGGRLFIELRDKKSLAYSVAPVHGESYFGGYFGAYIACDPSKKEEALKMLRAELQLCAEKKLSEKDLEWAKNQLLGSQAVEMQKNASICDQVTFDTLYGLESFQYRNLEKELRAISAEDLQKTAEEILSRPEYLVVVG